jgi:hypothetical protein
MSTLDNMPNKIRLEHVISRLGVSVRGVLSCIDRRTRSLVRRHAPEDDLLHVSDFVGSVTRLLAVGAGAGLPLGRVDLRFCG